MTDEIPNDWRRRIRKRLDYLESENARLRAALEAVIKADGTMPYDVAFKRLHEAEQAHMTAPNPGPRPASSEIEPYLTPRQIAKEALGIL